MSQQPLYSVIDDPMFHSFYTGRASIENTWGTYVDSLGNEYQFLSANTEFKQIDRNSAEVVISGIMRFDVTVNLVKVTFFTRISYCCMDYPICRSFGFNTKSFEAYIDGVTVNPGYYLFVVRIYVESGQFTQQ